MISTKAQLLLILSVLMTNLAFGQSKDDFPNLAKYKAANEQLGNPKPGEKRVVLLGNSITEFWLKRYPDFIVRNQFISRGISGQTSPQLLLRFQQDVVALKPAVVVIHIGTNDIAENTGPYNQKYTLGNIRSMVQLAQANKIKPILASVLPATSFRWRSELGDCSEKIIALNEAIRALAFEFAIPYVDYHTALKNDQNGLDVPVLSHDGVHPNEKAYEIMEKKLLSAIKVSLNE